MASDTHLLLEPPAPPDANQTQFDVWATTVASAVYLYYTPLLVLLGCVGNLLSVFVFYRSKLRLQSTSLYMSALAISDSVFLLQLVPPWLNTAGLSDVFLRAGFCQFFMYASYVSCGASSWLVVTFTLERLVAVKYPLRRNAVCTVARARLAATAIAVVALAFNTPVLRFAVPRDGYCSVDRMYLLAARRFNVIDTMLSFTAPLLVIVIVNILIVVDICRANNALHQFTRRVGSSPADDARSQRRVTTMLLKVSSVFVACNLPAYTFRLLAYDVNTDELSGRWTALQQIFILLFHSNSGMNFYLYCLTGQNFRRALVITVQQTIVWHRQEPQRPTRRPVRACSCSSSYQSHVHDTEPATGGGLATIDGRVTIGGRTTIGGRPTIGEPATSARPASIPQPTVTIVRNRWGKPYRRITRWKFNNSRSESGSTPCRSIATVSESLEMSTLE